MLGTEVLLVIIAACGTGVTSAFLFLGWADYWLIKKEKQVKELNDHLFHSFIKVMRDACEYLSEYDKKKEDDPITQREFEELVGWAKPIDAALRPVMKFDNVLNRLRVILRGGAATWLVAAFAATAAVIVEVNAPELAWPEAIALNIAVSLVVMAIIALAFSLFAFFYGIYISNRIDKEAPSASLIRSWKVRSG